MTYIFLMHRRPKALEKHSVVWGKLKGSVAQGKGEGQEIKDLSM